MSERVWKVTRAKKRHVTHGKAPCGLLDRRVGVPGPGWIKDEIGANLLSGNDSMMEIEILGCISMQ